MITINRQFHFCAAHVCRDSELSDQQNFQKYGEESLGCPGHGHNYNVYFVFEGPVDEKTGMIMELSQVKKKIEEHIINKYDHKYLNDDIAVFSEIIPTTKNVAKQLLSEAQSLFEYEGVRPIACHLVESGEKEATAYESGRLERHDWKRRVRDTYSGNVFLRRKIKWGDDCFIEFRQDKTYVLGVNQTFYASHQLRSLRLNDQENKACYGKCYDYHGHSFRLEYSRKGDGLGDSGLAYLATPVEELDVFSIMKHFEPETSEMKIYLNTILHPYQYQNLNQIDLLKDNPTTGEQLIQVLARQIELGDDSFYRLRLWETGRNKFTYRVK